MKIRYLALGLAVVLLSACGGTGTTSAPTEGTVSLFVMDRFDQNYREVWVAVQQVVVSDSVGQEHVLYQAQPGTGQVFNLSELSGIAALLNTPDLPAGAYSGLVVTLDNQVSLVANDGTTIAASFVDGATEHTLSVSGAFLVQAGQATALALDFDLTQFIYDPLSGLVTATVIMKNETQVSQLTRTYAEVEGNVTAIIDNRNFVLRPERGGAEINVVLHDSATVYDEALYSVAADISALQVGAKVEAYGNYDAASITLTAVRVKIDDEQSASGAGQEVEGLVQSYDAAAGSLVLDVREADFIPGSDTVAVINLANAVFTKGGLTLLAAGQRVEIKGSWDGSLLTAAVVEIEGAPSNARDDGDSYDDAYAEIEGRIDAVNGSVLTISITQAEHTSLSGVVEVDTAQAWIKKGSADCLLVGNTVEIKGAETNGSLQASVVEIETGCGSSSSDDDDSDDDDGNDNDQDDDRS